MNELTILLCARACRCAVSCKSDSSYHPSHGQHTSSSWRSLVRGRPSGWRCYRPTAITAPCLSGTWYAAWCTSLLSQPCVRNTRKWKSISRIFALACAHAECMHILTHLLSPSVRACLPALASHATSVFLCTSSHRHVCNH